MSNPKSIMQSFSDIFGDVDYNKDETLQKVAIFVLGWNSALSQNQPEVKQGSDVVYGSDGKPLMEKVR